MYHIHVGARSYLSMWLSPKEPFIHSLANFALTLGQQQYIPLLVGGMGVDVSTPDLVLAIAGLGGIAHLSDAMLPAVVDRHDGTNFVQTKQQQCRTNRLAGIEFDPFDLTQLRQATERFISETMSRKKGSGGIFLNVMEKLTMGNPRETLAVRLKAALDAGIDGLTLGAGLNLGSLELMKDHPRFRDAMIGIIVSSARALKLFLHRAVKQERLPDYIIVEGPLAGGHLGFPCTWQDFDLATIIGEVKQMLSAENLNIPVIPAGGIFTGSDAVKFMEQGAAAVQVATRFAVTKESGLPEKVKQAFFAAEPDDVEVNLLSATGYPMRMLKSSPAIGNTIAPQCDSYGYALDKDHNCSYKTARELYKENGTESEKVCLCSMMFNYKIWTCGHTVSRLKETTNKLPNGSYQTLTTEQVFNDYINSTDQRIQLPPMSESIVIG